MKPLIAKRRRRQGGTSLTSLPSAAPGIASGSFHHRSDDIKNADTPPEGMYCFVVKRLPDHDWRFVTIHHNRLVIMDHPRQFFRSPSDAIRDFWVMAAIAGEVGWDEPCDMSTLRLVKLRVEIEDASDHLFRDDDHRRESERLAAIAKLTDAECRLLGLTTERAKLKLYRSGGTPSFTPVMDEVSDLFMCKVVSDKVFERRSSSPFRLPPKQKRAKGA